MCYANFSFLEEVDHPCPMTEKSAVPFSRGVGEEVVGDNVEEEAEVEAIEAEATLGLNSVRLGWLT